MFSPRNAQIIALLLTFSFVTGTQAQTTQDKPPATQKSEVQKSEVQKPEAKPEASKPRDYSQEAVVIEQLSTAYSFERNGTGKRELTLRAKVQSDAGVQRFGQLVFGYSSANEKFEMDYVRVRKADGTVVNATTSDIQHLSAPVAREAPI